MDILRKETNPIFYIVPRKTLDISRVLKFNFINENTKETQEILSDTIELLPNETYLIELVSFPIGDIHNKFSYTIIDNLDSNVVSLGKMMIVSETESVQDYSSNSTNKFYS